jgi:hypothetical protein
MTASVGVNSTSGHGAAFWERLWRTAGIQSVGLFILAYLVYGHQPQVGASADALVAFYDGGRTRILIAAVLSGLAVLNLMWFAAALRTTLADAGQDGWGAAATASSAAVGGLFLLLVMMGAALAYSIAGSGNHTVTSGLNDLAWACAVLTSFPRAMLIMSGTFGFWRARLISKPPFAAGVAAVALTLLGGMMWMSPGFLPDGAYSRFISPLISFVWVMVVSERVLLSRPLRVPDGDAVKSDSPCEQRAEDQQMSITLTAGNDGPNAVRPGGNERTSRTASAADMDGRSVSSTSPAHSITGILR